MTDTAIVQQSTASEFGDGTLTGLRQSRIRQLFTADWKQELMVSGRAFTVSVGGITAGADVLLVTGGGSGTVIDSDQPEMIVGVDAGFYMIPLAFTCATQVDLDADTEVGNIILFADTTQAPPASVTGVVETPSAVLDSGNHSSIARAFSAITADITDPVASINLGYATTRLSAVSAASAFPVQLRLDFDPSVPHLLKGPCSVVAAWGGTAAVTGICSFTWAEVPITRFD